MANKTALITGTSTGIGEACVQRLATAGWTVYAGVRKEADGERVRAASSGDVRPVILDVTDHGQIRAVLDRIGSEVGSLDGLVNNAGAGMGGPIESIPDDEWRWQFDVNFFGLVTLTREAFPLVDRAGGRFVHVGSIAGRVAAPGLGPYTASKHAVSAFNWTLRAELVNTKMHSSVIEPGEIKTAIWGKAEDLLSTVEARLTPAQKDRYAFMLDGQRAFVDHGNTKGVEADRVAKAVEHALTARRPRARYLVGPDAQFAGRFVARLPDAARELLLGANTKQLAKKGRALRSGGK